jgi:hypothetical protein
MEGNNMEVYQ